VSKPPKSNGVIEFWRAFSAEASALASAPSTESPVYDGLLEELQRIHPDLYLEFCVEPGACELIVTADGDKALFGLAREVVAAAPQIVGWRIRALRPRLGFPSVVTWNETVLELAEVVFEPLERKDSNALGLRIMVPGLHDVDAEDAHNAILRAMDHGLGEEHFAESVQHTELCSLPAGVPPDRFIPITSLEEFIQWRASRNAH
jgi:hypothetical protein